MPSDRYRLGREVNLQDTQPSGTQTFILVINLLCSKTKARRLTLTQGEGRVYVSFCPMARHVNRPKLQAR